MRILKIGVLIIAAGLPVGCANQPGVSGPVTAASYCQAQGSEMAVAQCQQYYARYHFAPPQPVVYQPQEPAMDPHDRAMLIAAYLSRPQPESPLLAVFRASAQEQRQVNCSSNRVGDFVSTTCN
jgi:hypothetical protein